MKHRRVFGPTARYALSYVHHGLPPRPSLSPHAFSCHRARQKHTHAPSPDTWTVRPPLQPSIHPHSSVAPDSAPYPMGEQLRAMMRLLAHSVVVCTSSSASATATTPSPRGMTVSSFTSLSLAPPLVTFHVASPSRTLDAVRASGRLNMHVLAGDAAGARVAHLFTGGNTAHTWSPEALRGAGVRVLGWDSDGGNDGDAAAVGTAGPPVLEGPGVMYVLRCGLFDEAHGGVVMVRDHAIVVAEVLEIVEASAKTDGHGEEFGLVYADRHYRQLGNALVRERTGSG